MKNERHGNMPLVGVYNIGLLLLDFCAHNGVGLAIVEDDELTVAEEFVRARISICINIFYRREW